MSEPPVPESLRRAVESDLRPVRPIAGPWHRTLAVAAVATVVLAGALVVTGAGGVGGPLPIWAFWASLGLQLGYGLLLVHLALREATPGLGAPVRLAVTAVGAAWALLIAAAVATYRDTTTLTASECVRLGMDCMRNEGALALPALLLTLWLVFRALPVRPVMAGFAGGAGAALIADAVNHLICPLSNLRHVLTWHFGAMVVLTAVGAVAGWLWRLRQRRQVT